MSNIQKSNFEKLIDFFNEQLQDGYILDDKASELELRKKAHEKFSIPTGSSKYVQKALRKVMVARNIVISEKSNDSSIEGEIKKDFSPIQQKPEPTESIEPAPKPTLPLSETTQQGQKPKLPLDPAKKEQYERFFKNGLGFVKELYIDFGIVKGKRKVEEEPIDTIEKFEKKVDEFAIDSANLFFEENVDIPAWFNWIGLFLSALMIFGAPLLRKLFLEGDDTDDKKESEKKKSVEEELANQID